MLRRCPKQFHGFAAAGDCLVVSRGSGGGDDVLEGRSALAMGINPQSRGSDYQNHGEERSHVEVMSKEHAVGAVIT
jgi:hypothetical protein